MIRRTLPALTALLLIGCGSPPEPKVARPREVRVADEGIERNTSDLFESVELAQVEPGTYGPVSVSLADGSLSVWATPGDAVRDLYVAALDRRGRVRGAPFVLGQSPGSLGLVLLRAVEKERAAALVYSVQPEAHSAKLFLQLLDGNGHQKASPVELVTTHDPLLWVELVDTTEGPVVFYATGQQSRAEIRSVGLGLNGAIRFADREVASGLRAWQIAPSTNGAALGVVRADEQGRGGRVELLLLDAQSALIKPPIALQSGTNAELDLDLARVGKNFVLAWSERRRVDARIVLAALDPNGNVVAEPAFATPALGEQALVKLVPSGALGRAALVWEELNLPADRRRVSLMEIDDSAKRVSDVASLPCSVQSSQMPEIVATSSGWSILTLDDGAPSANGELGEPTPIYVELGPKLTPKAAAALRFAEPKDTAPLLAWGLDCRDGCRATVAFDGPKVELKTALLSSVGSLESASAQTKAVSTGESSTVPRLEQFETLLEVEPVADFAVTPYGANFELSYVTYFDPSTPLTPLVRPGPDGRREPLQSRVDVVTIPETFQNTQTSTVSYRATSQPGVSLAAGADGGERVLAWSALDQGSPQLFLSRIGADGKKLGQRMLTHRKGGLDEVSVVPSGDGFLAAWLDERAGNSALYVTRVTKSLERRGSEQRVSQGLGQVTALAVLPRNGFTLVVWSEVRAESPRRQGSEARQDGQSRRLDLYARRLSNVDATPLSPPKRLLELSGAVRFLSATPHESGAVLSWLEVMQAGNSVDEPGRVRFLRLDDEGQVAGTTTGLSDTELSPVSVVLECPAKLCHGVVTLDVGGRGQLSAFVFDPAEAKVPELVPVVRSLGTVEQNVPPVLIGSHVFAIDQVDAERVRLQHATIRWE